MAHKIWNEEEMLLVFQLYLQTPFGKMHKSNPDVIALAKLIGRTPNSVAFRLGNYAHLDPFHQNRGIKGMSNGKKKCQPIWDKYNEDKLGLLLKMERIAAKSRGKQISETVLSPLENALNLKGKTKERLVKTRVNQSIFRKMVLYNYDFTCAISGINHPNLLVAGHIIPWAANQNEQLNPSNGICLSNLYDSAFDKGLIAIKSNYKIVLSKELKKRKKEPFYDRYFGVIQGKKLSIPKHFSPSKEFLKWHYDHKFKN